MTSHSSVGATAPSKPEKRFPKPWLQSASLWVPLSLVILSGIVLAILILQLRGGDIRAGIDLTNTLARLVEEQTSRTIQGIEQTLEQADAKLPRDGQTPETVASVRQDFRSLLANRPFLRAIWVLDANGVMLFDSDEGNIGINLSDRNYFKFHQSNPGTDFEIHTPTLSRTMGSWFISAVKTLRNENGVFSGVIVAAIEPQYFNLVWTIDPSQSASTSIALFRRDGTMLMRTPFDASAMGTSFAGSPLFREVIQQGPTGSYKTFSRVDKKMRFYSYRTITAHPDILVSVGETVEHALSSWRRFTVLIAAGWIIASLMLVTLGLSLRREWGRRLNVEAELHQSYERANTIMDHIADGVISIDETGMVKDFRKSAEQIFGYSAAEVVGQSVNMLMPEPYRLHDGGGLHNDMATSVPQIIGRNVEVTGRRKDGTEFPMELSVAQVAGLTGGTEYVGTVRDISSRKAVEDQLRQAQKMEAVGQLTGGVAHDFNNMLTVIIGNADLLVESIDKASPLHNASRLILESAEASSELVRRLLAFARRQPLLPQHVNVRHFAAKVKGLLSRILGEHIDIAVSVPDEIWMATIDPAQLESCLLNLAINARDAMPKGGRILIEAQNATIDAELDAPGEIRPGDYVVIAVSDNGTGMSEETMSRVFEPFFTTKEVGKGTGLGLSMVYGFIHQSGGHVKIYSEVGFGTTIKLFLPRAKEGTLANLDERDVAPPAISHGEHILVVEDDAVVRAYIAGQLTRLGYAVTTAHNGKEALALLSGPAPLHLLFTDIVMPGPLTGWDIAKRAQELRPGMRMLFTSGYTQNAITTHGRFDAGMHFLSKPYRLHQLAAKIREALD